MSQVTSDFSSNIITIEHTFNINATQSEYDSTPYLSSIDEEYVISYIELEKVIRFTKFEYTIIGELNTRYIETYYRISRNGDTWSNWLILEEEIINFPPFDPLDKMWIDIKFIRKGTKLDGNIRITSYKLIGDLYKSEASNNVILPGGETMIETPFIFKVFRIDNVEIIPEVVGDVDIKYRFSQDNSRTWSDWEVLSTENISTKRINPVRFFQIQYLVKNNTSNNLNITDINLIGDFQNVTLDYQKTNLYGIRDCCQSNILGTTIDENGNIIQNTNGTLDSLTCTNDSGFPAMTDEEKAALYNPYQQNQALNLLEKLSNDAVELFGWKVNYFITDPDGNGIDYSLHEYQLFNIVCEGEIKVSVENNQFPDNQIVFNQFDLSLLDSFQITITKQMFKKAFGVQRRPSKEDYILFCDINRMFIVDHAQQFRDFNNAAIYYKVVLKKYNSSANVIAGSKAMKDRIKELTKNTTIDELFGIENEQDKLAVANKPQLQTLTRDPIRVEYKSDIIKELIENSTTIISKQHYDFSSLLVSLYNSNYQNTAAIVYKNMDSMLKISDNIGYLVWFNINNYVEDESYNLFSNYDSDNNLGWSINLINDNIEVKLNSDHYIFSLSGTDGVDDLYENVWYCYVLNIDQRNRKMEQWIYKRNVDIDSESDAKFLTSTVLENVYHKLEDITPVEFELEGTDSLIYVSDIKMTNLRLFSEIIPEDQHNKILNQYIIADDSKYLIFADNANAKVILGYHPYQ